MAEPTDLEMRVARAFLDAYCRSRSVHPGIDAARAAIAECFFDKTFAPKPNDGEPVIEVAELEYRWLKMKSEGFDSLMRELRAVAQSSLETRVPIDAGWLRDSFIERWEDEF